MPRHLQPSTRLAPFAAILLSGCYQGLSAGESETMTGSSSSTGAIDSRGLEESSADATGLPPGDDLPLDTTSDAPSTSDASSTSEGGDSSSTGEDGPPTSDHAPALDIVPIGLHVNQGVSVALADAGVAIGPDARSSAVLHGRRTLVFGTWQTAETFVPRAIRAELNLAYADGSYDTVVSEVLVDGPSGANPDDRHFTWTLEPEQLTPGTRWWVTLHELELGPDEATPPPRLPAVGDVELDDTAGDQRIRIVFVPYRHTFNGCSQVPPSDPAIIEAHRLAMESYFPTQEVELTVHPEVVFTESMATGDAVLMNITALRASEAPADDVYYYGFLLPCDPMTNYGGIAWQLLEPTSVTDAPYRAAVGIWYDYLPEYSYTTMVHEIGHNHGRPHVVCAGTESGTDPAYPNPGGVTGVFGWGIHDGQFRPPTHADYMSYCTDYWVSPYAWAVTLTVIEAIGPMAAMQPPTRRSDGALLLALHDGVVTAAQHVPTMTARATTHTEGGRAWLVREDGTDTQTTWQRERVPDSPSTFLTIAASTAAMAKVVRVEVELDGSLVTVPRASIR